MKIIGFNFTKLHAEKALKQEPAKKIATNIEFKDIEIEELAILPDNTTLKFQFIHEIIYEPKNAQLSFEGNILVAFDKERAKDVLKNWKKKQLEPQLQLSLYNFLLKKCTVKALSMEEDLNISTHIKLPRLTATPAK